VLDVTHDVVEHQPDVVVANTAIGMRAWVEAAQAAGVDDDLLGALRSATVLARGPKSASACHILGIPVAHEIDDERLDGVLAYLLERGVAGCRIAFQRHGDTSPAFVDTLRAAGADVVDVRVYRYGMPDDVGPARRLVDTIIDRRVDAVTFTSRPSIDNLFALADQAGGDTASALRDAFNTDVAAACVGPVCADGARANGIDLPLHPDRGRLGLLVRTLAEYLGSQAMTFDVGGLEVVMQGSVVVGTERVMLTPREAALLRVLARRPGAVVAAGVLLAEVWHGATDTHVVEVTVGRLRRRLAPSGLAVVAVAGRGYRLVAHTAVRAV
jgi:uroporphyrinogen-III synthase